MEDEIISSSHRVELETDENTEAGTNHIAGLATNENTSASNREESFELNDNTDLLNQEVDFSETKNVASDKVFGQDQIEINSTIENSAEKEQSQILISFPEFNDSWRQTMDMNIRDQDEEEKQFQHSKEQDKKAENTEITALKSQLEKMKRELDNAMSEIAVSAYLKESLVQTERQKNTMQEEIATLQALLVEATEGLEQESQLMKLRKRAKVLESENQDLKIQLRMTEGRQTSGRTAASMNSARSPLGASTIDRESLLGSAAVLTDKTKNMVRKMKSSVVLSFPSGALTPEEEMKKAQDDSEALKSIVEPLEEQIVALKGKLRETDSLLQSYEKRQASSLLEMESVAAWLNGEDRSKLELRLEEEAGDGYSEEEGQLYHAILAARIGMLTQSVDMLRWEKEELHTTLEADRREVKELRTSLQSSNSVLLAERSDHLDQIAAVMEIISDGQRQEIHKILLEKRNARRTQAVDKAAEKLLASRVVSGAEWERLQSRLDSLTMDAASQIESKEVSNEEVDKLREELKSVLKERENLLKDREHLQKNCAKYKDDLAKESAFRKEVEETWNIRGSEYRAQVTELQARLKTTEHGLEKLGGLYRLLQESGRRELKKLTLDREKIVRELQRLQEENDTLVGKHSALAETMANEMINLPNSQEEMHLLLLTYREDLITAKIAKERAEEKLKKEIFSMRAQLSTEEQGRTVLEEQYTQDVQVLKERIRSLEPSSLELDNERLKRRALETQLDELQNKQSLNAAESNKQIEAVRSSNENAMAQVSQLKAKISGLQADLDNSVAVQNDFVRLSQSLQVELEKIRQSEKEVRWQHEDDVADCNSCRTGLVKRRKENCKHCGRIFCGDCLSKQVASGPVGRLSRVCEVCHTLLVQHSAPYFASEAPFID